MGETVRLELARRGFFSGGGFSGSFMVATVRVKNIAFTKTVDVHYTPDGHNWKDFSLSHSFFAGDHDIFEGTVNEQVEQLVIRYTTGGQTQYDNYFGQNYRLDLMLAVAGKNVVLHTGTARRGTEAGGGFTVTTSWLEGNILVNNLSFAKSVGVRMSADGGATWQDTSASFAGQHLPEGTFIGPAEVWHFKTPELNLNAASPAFQFAVFYQNGMTGDTFWDNNFEQDYRVDKSDGATVR